MAKKIVAAILAVITVVGALCCLTACSDKEQLKIVYLGDSIAEAVLGPSPLSERENYGYYALVGKNNGYVYINRSVSGHKTDAMLSYISQEDQGAMMTKTHIMTADIIQVSILGNDMLQSGLTELIIERAKEKAGEIETEDTQREEILKFSRKNFAAIIAKLKELNPTAKLFIQTIYNPTYVGTPMIGKSARKILPEYSFDETRKYEDIEYGENSYRELGREILETLNNVIYDYHAEHPDEFDIIDVYEAFKKIYDEDCVRGKSLIYPDGIHPSNEGHAVIADITQRHLEELGLADGVKALKSYKDIKKDQLKRLFPQVGKDVYKAIGDAKSCEEVTYIYFRAIDGLVPELV